MACVKRSFASGLLCLTSVIVFASLAPGDSWPTYRHDPARSAMTAEALPEQPALLWVFQPRNPPEPAWPESDGHQNLGFDYGFFVTAAEGLAYFGSSADCRAYALDAASGKVRWSFLTGGPVRFAPTIWQGRAFVVSDDGWLYCLDAANGALLWLSLIHI